MKTPSSLVVRPRTPTWVTVLVLVGATMLGGTLLRDPSAYAAQVAGSTIVEPLDGDGNVKVHEQGQTQLVVDHHFSESPGVEAFEVDVSAFREIRVYLLCKFISLHMDVLAPGDVFRLKTIDCSGGVHTTFTIEVPGRTLRITKGVSQAPYARHIVIYGRSN